MDKMINRATKLILLTMLFGISLVGKAQSNVIDQIVWVVGDEAILKSDIENARLEMQARGERIEGDPYCIIPEQLAMQKLFLDQAKIDSVTVSTSDIAKSVTRYEQNVIANIGSKEKVEEYLGASMSNLREEWREQIQNSNMVQEAQKNIVGKKTTLTPSEVRRYYSQLPKDSLPYIQTNVEVQIITREPTIPLSETDKIRQRLREYTNRINSGDAIFSTLAISYSDDKGSVANGGELGFMGRAQLLPEFANVAFALTDPKKVSNIVETEYGFHIIQLIERRGDRSNFRHILLRPQIPETEMKETMLKMDSLKNDISAAKFTFEEATILSSDKDTRKNDGLMVNRKDSPNYGTPRFTMEELPPAVAKTIDKMKVGEISAPFRMKLDNEKEVIAIVRLKTRVDGHLANVSDDFQALKEIVENKKQQDTLKKWLQKKIKDTYVFIDKDWINCEFQYPGWVKEQTSK